MAECGSDNPETSGHDECFEWNCKMCSENGLMREATSYCKNCDEYFCKSCLQLHNRFHKTHTVLGVKEKVDWGTSDITQDTGIVCEDHHGQTISMYCGQHDALCCLVCAMFKHSESCKSTMSYIPQIAKGIKTSEEFKAAMKKIDNLLDRFTVLEQTNMDFKEKLNASREESLTDIESLYCELENHLKKLKEISILELERSHHEVDESIQEGVETCLQAKQELLDVQQQIQATVSINEPLTFVHMKTSDKIMVKCGNILTALGEIQYNIPKFRRNDTLLRMIKTSDYIGNIEKDKKTSLRDIGDHVASNLTKLDKTPTKGDTHSSSFSVVADDISKASDGKQSTLEDAANFVSYQDGYFKLERSKKQASKPDEAVVDKEMCVICMDDITDPKVLNCGHKFCTDCIDQSLTFKQACPTCGKVCGVITGDQPKGTMTDFFNELSHLSGYDRFGTIQISYNFPSRKQEDNHPNPGKWYKGIFRKAYLPDNKEGNIVFQMLKIAFDRKLVFTIGTSRTTGEEGVITWNDIYQKTNPTPYGKFGYPDPTYIERVTDELAAKGVTENDIPKKTLDNIKKRFK